MENDYYDVESMDESIIERFWQLYEVWCVDHAVKPRLKNFWQWYEERYI